MRRNNQDLYFPLDKPFLVFPSTPKPSYRSKASRTEQSLSVNHHSHSYVKQSRSSMIDGRASPFEFDLKANNNSSNNVILQEIGELIQNSKTKAKQNIQSDAAILREKIWLKVQSMFRKIEDIGDKFHEQVYTAVTLSEGKPGSLTRQVQNSLTSYINNFGTLYSSQRANKIINKVIDKMTKYLDEVVQKYGSNLFHFQTDSKSNLQKQQNSHNLSYDLQLNRSRNIQNKTKINSNYGLSDRKYTSLQKYNQTAAKSPSVSNADFKNMQQKNEVQNSFDKVYRTIRQSRQKQKLNQSNQKIHINNSNNQLDAYGLIPKQIQLQQRQKTLQSQHSRMSSFYSQALRTLPNRAHILQASHAHSTSYANNMRNGNNVTISPVISRVKIDDQHNAQRNNKKNNNAEYVVGSNQQNMHIQWCQEISINSADIITTNIVPSHQQIGQYNKVQNRKNVPLCLTYCNNFQNLAIGSQNSLIHIYKCQNPSSQQYQKIATLHGHSSSICTLHYNNNNNILFSGGDVQCCSIYLWCTTNWTMRSKLNFHSAAISSIVSITNTDCILSASYDKTIILYNYTNSHILSSKNQQNKPYLKLLYYQQMQKVIAMTPSTLIDVFQLQMGNVNGFQLKSQQGIACGAQVNAIQKVNNILAAGLSNGTIQLFNICDKSFIKRLQHPFSSILSMLTISRSTKPNLPLLICACQSSRVLHMINTETGYTKQLNVKGNMNIVVGCGISPVIVIGDQRKLAWVQQDGTNARFHTAKFNIY